MLYLALQGLDGREKPPEGSPSGPNATHTQARKPARSSSPSPTRPPPGEEDHCFANSSQSWLRRQRSISKGHGGTGHSPKFKQQRLLQAQQGCAHSEEEDGGAKEDVLRAVAAPQRKRSSREQEEAKAHKPLQGKARQGGAGDRARHRSEQPKDSTPQTGCIHTQCRKPSIHPRGFLHFKSRGRGSSTLMGKVLALALEACLSSSCSCTWKPGPVTKHMCRVSWKAAWVSGTLAWEILAFVPISGSESSIQLC